MKIFSRRLALRYNLALKYYFRKGTSEVRHFLPKNAYQNISKDIDGILHYTGRILPSQNIEIESDLQLGLWTIFDTLIAADFL